jgi:hypothetical protein
MEDQDIEGPGSPAFGRLRHPLDPIHFVMRDD